MNNRSRRKKGCFSTSYQYSTFRLSFPPPTGRGNEAVAAAAAATAQSPMIAQRSPLCCVQTHRSDVVELANGRDNERESTLSAVQ